MINGCDYPNTMNSFATSRSETLPNPVLFHSQENYPCINWMYNQISHASFPKHVRAARRQKFNFGLLLVRVKFGKIRHDHATYRGKWNISKYLPNRSEIKWILQVRLYHKTSLFARRHWLEDRQHDDANRLSSSQNVINGPTVTTHNLCTGVW